jgi:aspartate aminotransferase
MAIAMRVQKSLQGSSLIRKMFEEGARLKKQYGAENVFDFSIGNPNLPPPGEFYKSLASSLVAAVEDKNHSYMPQAGNPATRQAVANFARSEYLVDAEVGDVFMTAGAAGALNIIFKSLLNPGDEVLTPAPCFVEYGFYTDNYDGVFVTAPTKTDFTLDLDAMAKAITAKTKIIIINSPNNPTGQIYSEDSLQKLGALVAEKEKEFDTEIYLISDEPYRKIIYVDEPVPSILLVHPRSIIVTSHSKDLSIPGERIGYAVLNPTMPAKQDLLDAMSLTARVLGHVNAPAFMQRVVANTQGVTVDVGLYKRKRDLLCEGLAAAGYEFTVPPGAFYLFPKSPLADDVAFADMLKEEKILVVPGSGFMGPGYFRISYCVDDQTIINALPGFKRVLEKI